MSTSRTSSSPSFKQTTATPPANLSASYLYNGFERFKTHYLSSTPVKLALARSQYSVGDANKVEKYFRKAYQHHPQPKQGGPSLPPFLLAVLACQEGDGRWYPSPAVDQALGGLRGIVPEPPCVEDGQDDGLLVGWRWTTALVLAMLRRDCAVYLDEDMLYEAYQQAISWISDDLLSRARDALIPRDLYFPVDEELLRKGRWKEGAEYAMQNAGYQAFVNDDMKANARLLEAKLLAKEEYYDDDASTVSSTTRIDITRQSLSAGQSQADEGASVSRGSQSDTAASSPSASAAPVLTIAQRWERVKAKKRGLARQQKVKQEEDWRQVMLAAEFNLLCSSSSTASGINNSVVNSQANARLQEALLEEGQRGQRQLPTTTTTTTEMTGESISSVGESSIIGSTAAERSNKPSSSSITSSVPSFPTAVKDYSTLADVWQNIILNKEEVKRLKELEARLIDAPPESKRWDGSKPSVAFESTKKIAMADIIALDCKKKEKRCRQAKDQQKQQQVHPTASSNTSTRKSGSRGKTTTTLENPSLLLLLPSKIGEERKRCEAQVVMAVLVLEDYVKEVKSCVERCLNRYRSCRLLRDRAECLDEVTVMLGQYQAPRPGYVRWAGKGVKGLQNVICEVVEAVERWRQAMFEEEHGRMVEQAERETDLVKQLERLRQAKAMTIRSTPFIYNGENVILSLPYIAEFLSDYPELRSHYGSEFLWKRNPFLRAITLDQRPPTPRKGTRLVKIGEQMKEMEVESGKEMRQQEVLCWQEMEAKLAGAGQWWPGVEAIKQHKERVRRAEKVILAEEKIHGKYLHLSHFYHKKRHASLKR